MQIDVQTSLPRAEEFAMRVSLTEANGQLTELVRLAEAGDDVVLTRDGEAAVRLVPIPRKPTATGKQAVFDRVRASSFLKLTEGPDAARSQDFLYDELGLPK
jgi:prevent-host-death family protein